MTSLSIGSFNSNLTVDLNYEVLLLDATSATFTVTLPLIPANGVYLILKRIDSNILTTVNLVATSPNTIIGGTLSFALSRQVVLISYNDNWYVLS